MVGSSDMWVVDMAKTSCLPVGCYPETKHISTAYRYKKPPMIRSLS